MDDLIEALQIFRKYASAACPSPTHCVHDQLWITWVGVEVSAEDVRRLNELGFLLTDDGWMSLRFGSA